jgi:DNA-binding transcriptional regulator YhcF (GntR family)
MHLAIDEGKPIYIQIAEGIEDEILKSNIPEGEQVPSTNQFASMFEINPATAAKGINMLVDEGILYKKRGIGMFVAEGARNMIIVKRKNSFFEQYILKVIQEAGKLGISKEEIVEMIKNYPGGENK